MSLLRYSTLPLYPIPERSQTLLEKSVALSRISPGFCPLCSRLTVFRHWGVNFRETGRCVSCGSINRHRQIALVLGACFEHDRRYRRFSSNNLKIYNLEANGAMHRTLVRNKGTELYCASEFLGKDRRCGEIYDGVRHEDAHKLSFPDETFDLVISSEVWEHLHSPYVAHAEVFRVLKSGGRHVFTAPFYQTHVLDETRAVMTEEGGGINYLLDPIYHLDPLDPNGVLVYTIFSLETLVKLSQIGFVTKLYKVYSPIHGVFGNNGIVIDARKP